jgi:hypothetical protein
MQVAETFAFEIDAAEKATEKGGRQAASSKAAAAAATPPLRSLMDVARLDTCVTVVDAASFHANLSSIEELQDRCALLHRTVSLPKLLRIGWDQTVVTEAGRA